MFGGFVGVVGVGLDRCWWYVFYCVVVGMSVVIVVCVVLVDD